MVGMVRLAVALPLCGIVPASLTMTNGTDVVFKTEGVFSHVICLAKRVCKKVTYRVLFFFEEPS